MILLYLLSPFHSFHLSHSISSSFTWLPSPSFCSIFPSTVPKLLPRTYRLLVSLSSHFMLMAWNSFLVLFSICVWIRRIARGFHWDLSLQEPIIVIICYHFRLIICYHIDYFRFIAIILCLSVCVIVCLMVLICSLCSKCWV